MNWFSFENLLITIFCLTLAGFIAKYAENKSHRIWAYFNCAVAVWAMGSFWASTCKTPESAKLFWKLAIFGSIFISILFYHFVCVYCKLKRKNILIFLYALGSVFSLLTLFTNLFVRNLFLVFNSFYYYKATICSTVWFITWNITVIFAFYEFGRHIKTDSHRQVPSLIMFWAMLVGFLGGISSTFPIYGLMIYPGYQISVCLYALLVAYGIFYHRLLPIDIVLKRSITYSLLAAIISLTYIFSVLISQQVFHQYFGYSSTIIGSIIIAIAFIPIKSRIQYFLDCIFLKASPLEIAHQNEQLRKEITQSERMKSIAIFASGIAHEIKNPLTPIKTFSEQLPSRLDDKEFLLKFSRIINKEVDRIDSLVHDLLNFAKPAAPELKETNINQLIEKTLDILNIETLRRKIYLNTSLKNKSNIVKIDQQQIKQALLNIFLNAIDAMPEGGTVSVNMSKSSSGRIVNKRTNPKQSLIIKISDTGCGIDPRDLPFIFDPFFSKKDNGTGLGLAITHEIIQNHKGKIIAESELGKGTCFTIELPL
jgi:signal transduction histidine kinase